MSCPDMDNVILKLLADGKTWDEILILRPTLFRSDIEMVVKWAELAKVREKGIQK